MILTRQISILGILLLLCLSAQASFAQQRIYYGDENYSLPQKTLIIDENDLGGNLKLQFGNSLNKYILWDSGTSQFTFSDNVDLGGNEMRDFRVENVTSAPICDGTRTGRMYHNTLSSKTFVCDGTDWEQIDPDGDRWSFNGGVLYPETATTDIAIGGGSLASSMFSIDEDTGTFLFGGDQSANPTLNFEATDGDAGTFGFNTNDSFYFSNANVGIGTVDPASPLVVYENTTAEDDSVGFTIEQEGTGDALAQFLLPTVQRWVVGIDNSDADKFKIASSQSLDSDAHLTIQTDGFVGIGTVSPNTMLQVDGGILASENALTASATIAIDWRDGNQQTVTLNQTGHTVTFSNYQPGQILRLIACQDGTGSRTITTWPSDIDWAEDYTPVLTTTPGQCDVLSFIATNARGSVEIFGSAALNF